MKSGFWGSSSAVTVIRRRILLICASTIFWISWVLVSRNASTVNVGRVSFFGGGGASGLVRLVWVALTSDSFFVYRPCPLLAGFASFASAAIAAAGTRSSTESEAAKIPCENRNGRMLIDFSTILIATWPLRISRRIGSTASARRRPRALRRHLRHPRERPAPRPRPSAAHPLAHCADTCS